MSDSPGVAPKCLLILSVSLSHTFGPTDQGKPDAVQYARVGDPQFREDSDESDIELIT